MRTRAVRDPGDVGATRRSAAIVLGAAFAACAASQSPPRSAAWPPEWTQEQKPFAIVDNVYYVGSVELASYLIVTPEGLILLDTGSQEDAALIRRSVAALGFEIGDLRILLNSQAHLDHAAGFADLKASTGAELQAMSPDADLLEAGGRGDFAFGNRLLFPAVRVDRRLQHGDTVELGGTRLTAIHTPGHTRGCTTWLLTVAAAGGGADGVTVVFAGSTTINPGVRLTEPPSYPAIAADFVTTLDRLAELASRTDVFLSAHASFFDLAGKLTRRENGERDAFFDREGYARWVQRSRERYLAQLEKERGDR